MIRETSVALVVALFAGAVNAQTNPSPSPSPRPPAPTVQTRPQTPFDLAEYGVRLQPDERLIVMMAALDAAGLDPTPPGKEPSPFRALVRKDQANLDAGLRDRLKTFFELNR